MKKQNQPDKDKKNVSDGDTRPDMQGTEETVKKPDLVIHKNKEKITKNRGADVNTLEDYKDVNS